MPTLYYRRDTGTYWINYRVDGTRVRRPVGKDRRLAELALKELEVRKGRGALQAPAPRKRLEEFLVEYLASIEVTHGAWTIRAAIRPSLEAFRAFLESDPYLTEITAKDIEEFRATRLRSVKPITANRDFRVLRAMFNRAIAWGYLDQSPCRGLAPLRRIPQNPPRYLSMQEVDRLLGVAEGHPLYPLIAMGIFAGLRRSELAFLEWEDVDFERGLIHVRNKDEFHTKNYRSRTIPLNVRLREALVPYRQPTGWCFPNARGGPNRHRLLRSFKLLCRKAGIENCHLHSLRHTFASLLVSAGVSVYKVSQWLGHSDVKTTMIYAHLAPQDGDINRIGGTM